MLSIGQHVVCINDKFTPHIASFYTALPVKGRTYVIREIQLGITPAMEGAVSLLLVGLHNPRAKSKSARERGFNAERFRPLDEMKEKATTHENKPSGIHRHAIEVVPEQAPPA